MQSVDRQPQHSLPTLPTAWLARRAVTWSRQAKAEDLVDLEQALLAVAAAAVDAYLLDLRRRLP